MASEFDVQRHLAEQLATADPWRLESNPFEQRRYDALMDAIGAHAPFAEALEVGCAAGAFTERLAPLCTRLQVIDLLPEAIARAKGRLARADNVDWRVADVAVEPLPEARFDLIVVAEVLYYLPDLEALARAIDNLVGALKAGGVLIFGSARDEACRRWGLIAGAETAMQALERRLQETGRVSCRGVDWGEDCLIVSYTYPPSR